MTCDDIKKRLGENVKRIRKEQNLTQFQLAEKADLSDVIKMPEIPIREKTAKTSSVYVPVSAAPFVKEYSAFPPAGYIAHFLSKKKVLPFHTLRPEEAAPLYNPC